jgi:hypothetical protein
MPERIKDKQCGCCMNPVDEEIERCDLCSEATGTNNGWKITYCETHAAAHDTKAALKAAWDALGKDPRWRISTLRLNIIRPALRKAGYDVRL